MRRPPVFLTNFPFVNTYMIKCIVKGMVKNTQQKPRKKAAACGGSPLLNLFRNTSMILLKRFQFIMLSF